MLPHGNCYRVGPQLIAGEYPGGPDFVAAKAKLDRHLDVGITYFLDLTELGELRDYTDVLGSTSAAHGVTAFHRRMPIRDASLPDTPAIMVAILDALDTAIATGHTVYLHCWGGIGRTGTVVGCWLVRHGMTGDKALETIASHWQGVEKHWRQPRSPETDEQHAYVRGWSQGAFV
ncbi:phosphatase [Chloroflexales bacterium ZM16-3]|nr:phosphatase [Chloroflexales bacterium ZM16-3]